MEENFSMEWNMEWKIFGMEWNMEWKKITSMEYGKNCLPFHSILCPGSCADEIKLISAQRNDSMQ